MVGEIRIPKKFTQATNPRFSSGPPSGFGKFDSFKELKTQLSKTIREDPQFSVAQRKNILRGIHNAETKKDLAPYFGGDLGELEKNLGTQLERSRKDILAREIYRDLLGPDGKPKPGKSLAHLPPKFWELPEEEIIKLLPRQGNKGHIRTSPEAKDLKAFLRSKPKFEDEQEYNKFIDRTIHKEKEAATREEIKRAHDQKVFNDALFPDRSAQEAMRKELGKKAAEVKPIKSYMKDLPAFTHQADLTATHGSAGEQQLRHAMLEQLPDIMSIPHRPFPGNRVAERDPLENLALEEIRQNAPHSVKNLAHHENQRKRVEALSSLPKQSKVAAPYLNRSAGNPLDVFKGQLDKDVLEKIGFINEDMDKKFREDYLPRIERVNKIGPARYGSVGKALERATAEHEKGKQRSIREALLENNRTALQSGQNYLGHQANLGEIASRNASQERGDEERASHFLAQQHQNEQNETEKHIGHLKSEGALNRAREQQVLNENHDEFDRAQLKPYENLVKATNILSKMPQVATAFQTHSNIQAPVDRPNNNQQFGGGMFNAGSGQFIRQNQQPYFKKGGLVRRKKAQGGILGNAVDNAVIEHSSPLYELKRLINKGNAMDISQTKIGKRRKYNMGGAVNPIQAGAEQAAAFKEKDNLRNYLSQRQQAPAESTASQMMNDFMVGVSNVGGDNFLGNAAKSYKESSAQRDAKKEASEQRKLQSLMADYQLEKDSRTEDQLLKKADRDEKYREKLLSLKSDILNRTNTAASEPSLKMDEVDKDIYKKANNNLMKASAEMATLKKMETLLSNMSTGPGSTKYTGKGTLADKEAFDSLAGSIFGKDKGAPHRGMSKEAIKSVINGRIEKLKKEAELSNLINENSKKGISPKDSLYAFQKANPDFLLEEEGTALVAPSAEKPDETAETKSALVEDEEQDLENQIKSMKEQHDAI